MSQSRGTLPRDAGIGDRPMPLGAWDKYQLGWLDAAVVKPGKSKTVKLRPGQEKGTNPNGIVVRLPDKKIRQNLGAPCGEECGDRYFYSDKGNDLDNNMKRAVDGGGELTAKVKYEIEDGWDYAFLEVSSDNGASWQQIDTSENYDGADQSGYDPNDVGISGNTEGEWVDLTATVPDGTNEIRWRYITDGAFVLDGFQLDNITLDGEVIGDAETQDEGWTYRGFMNTGGNDLVSYTNAYFVDNRSVHQGLDKPLSHLYNFGFPNPDRVEFFALQQGCADLATGTRRTPTTTSVTTRATERSSRSTPTRASCTRPTEHSCGLGSPARTRRSPTSRARSRRCASRGRSTRCPRGRRCGCSTTPDATGPTATSTVRESTSATTSPAGTASTCRGPEPRSASSRPPRRESCGSR